MKYIVFSDMTACIFGNHVSHKAMAANRPVKSAGFCMLETTRNSFDDIRLGYCSCFGRSDSLGVESDPEDSKILEEMFMGMN